MTPNTETDFDFPFDGTQQPQQQQTTAPAVQPQVQAEAPVNGEYVPPTVTAEGDAPKPQVEAQTPAPALKTKKVFSRNDIVRSIPINVVFPKLYPDFEPFGFKFRLKLSVQAEEERQNYLALSAAERTEKESQQSLNEVCDLLTELPTGFSDLMDIGGPGPSFRSYIETTTDPDMKAFLSMVVNAADIAYWNAVAPREFRG